MYRSLDPDKIVSTLEQLERRINERFPHAGLGKVCGELTGIARASRAEAAELQRPHLLLRGLSALVILLGLGLILGLATLIRVGNVTGDLYDILQGVDAAFNVALLSGGALLFLVTLEGPWKRGQALGDLNELRSIIHVIDMHQLTKDPSALEKPLDTPSSPLRQLDAYALTRYLDYCSEMLSLSAKVAVLYAQSTNDPVVIEASSDLQQIPPTSPARSGRKSISSKRCNRMGSGAQVQWAHRLPLMRYRLVRQPCCLFAHDVSHVEKVARC